MSTYISIYIFTWCTKPVANSTVIVEIFLRLLHNSSANKAIFLLFCFIILSNKHVNASANSWFSNCDCLRAHKTKRVHFSEENCGTPNAYTYVGIRPTKRSHCGSSTVNCSTRLRKSMLFTFGSKGYERGNYT